MEDTLEKFLCNLLSAVLMVVVVIAAIGALGVQTTSLLAVLGAAGLAVGQALQGSLSNFASGVLIVAFRPYKVGDFIEAAGVAGTVKEVQILTTIHQLRLAQLRAFPTACRRPICDTAGTGTGVLKVAGRPSQRSAAAARAEPKAAGCCVGEWLQWLSEDRQAHNLRIKSPGWNR